MDAEQRDPNQEKLRRLQPTFSRSAVVAGNAGALLAGSGIVGNLVVGPLMQRSKRCVFFGAFGTPLLECGPH